MAFIRLETVVTLVVYNYMDIAGMCIVHETFQVETETRPETQMSEMRPRIWAFC